ncbi:helix-turn-helix domain-containing protein [Paenibacillus silviterrae]|uniref:helix-turn-helix domain-containing protein n=1 Tax=Paenibacillus silviterrae TaxID=3242194 RepID=UPI002543831C|nr:helix-turn-helix domain-containing protein [Paenibacillus chinjuensis]
MNSVRKPSSFRRALFWRFFTTYFVVILIPVIAASLLAHVLVVRTIEKDAEKLNDVILTHFSKQTDTAFTSLKTNMINMLSTSNLRSLLLVADDSPENTQRAELIYSIREQLLKLSSDPLVSNAFLYFANHNLIIDSETYTDKSYYFDFRYPLSGGEKTAFLTHLTNKKMMDFTDLHADHISALMSYPFNTDRPEVYLVVNFRQDQLMEHIRIPEQWVTGTAIVAAEGRIVSRTGLTDEDTIAVAEQVRVSSKGTQFLIADDQAISLLQSSFDDSWVYATIADVGTLMKPAHMVRAASWAFLCFFLVVGSIASYYLSRRQYRPIREIKERLEAHRVSNEPLRSEGNEFDVIKRFSQVIITENQELSQQVNGMYPVVQEHFITKILLGEYRDSLSIEYYAKEIDFVYDKNTARTVLCIAFHYDFKEYDRLSETSKSFMMIELRERILKSLPSPVWLCQTKPGILACVLQQGAPPELEPEPAAERIKALLEQYSQYYKATVGLGSTVHAVHELHVSYEQAMTSLQYRGLDADVEICKSTGPGLRGRPVGDSFLSVQEVTRIMNQYKTKEYEKLLQAVLEMLEEGRRRNAAAIQVKAQCADVLNTWVRAVESEQSEVNIPFYSGLFEQLNRCMTWEELRSCFMEIHSQLFRLEETGRRTKQFADILAYIHEHYHEELSIEHFAGLMNMSSGHFSRTFKEEVGEKYVEYIAKYRLMKAKQYLLETDLKIDDIAEKVGYWGRNSFIRTFRKYEGITPAKYRAIHQP